MLKLSSIFDYIHNGLVNGDERYVIINDEEVMDNKTGVKLFMCDDWFKLTHGDVVIVTMSDLLDEECKMIWNIKKLITDPEVLKDREENYQTLMQARREKLSSYFENPEPIVMKAPVVEVDATEYEG